MAPATRKKFSYSQDPEDRKALDQKWEKLNSKLKLSHPDFEVPVEPFASNVLIKDFNELYSRIYDKEKFIQS